MKYPGRLVPLEVLADALQISCGLFNQLVSENTRLRKLGSHDRPTKPCIRRVNGKGQILTAEKAIAFDEAKVNEQSRVVHELEHDFLVAVQSAKEAIKQPDLAGAIDPYVSKPKQWLRRLVTEMWGMERAAQRAYPSVHPVYPWMESPSNETALAANYRMAALHKVQARLNHAQCCLELWGCSAYSDPPQQDLLPVLVEGS